MSAGAGSRLSSAGRRSNPLWDHVLYLQRLAGNGAVADLLVQRQDLLPGQSDVVKKREEVEWETTYGEKQPYKDPTGKTPDRPLRPVPKRDKDRWGHLDTPVPKPFQGAVSSDPLERQPEPLRKVICASARGGKPPAAPEADKQRGENWWAQLDPERKLAVTSIYNKFQSLGIWSYVQLIRQVVKGESPWLRLQVAGDTPSVIFEGDAAGLMTALLGSGSICYDAGIGGALHGGQSSNREITPSDSLHVSVGKGVNAFDAHIDKYGSPKAKKGLACEYDPMTTAAHEGREVVPSMLRKGFRIGIGPDGHLRVYGPKDKRGVKVPGVGGVEIFPEDKSKPGIRPELLEPPDRERDQAPPMGVGGTYRF